MISAYELAVIVSSLIIQMGSFLWSVCTIILFGSLCTLTGLLCACFLSFISKHCTHNRSHLWLPFSLMLLGLFCIVIGSLLWPLCILTGSILWSFCIHLWAVFLSLIQTGSFFWPFFVHIWSVSIHLGSLICFLFIEMGSYLVSFGIYTGSLLWSLLMLIGSLGIYMGSLFWSLCLQIGSFFYILLMQLGSLLLSLGEHIVSIFWSVCIDFWSVLFTLSFLMLLWALSFLVVVVNIFAVYFFWSLCPSTQSENAYLYVLVLFGALTVLASKFYWLLFTKMMSLHMSLGIYIDSLLWLFKCLIFLVPPCVFVGLILFRFCYKQNEPEKWAYYLTNVDWATFWDIKKIIQETFSPEIVGIGKDAKGLQHLGIEVINIQKIVHPRLLQTYNNQVQKIHKRKHTCVKIKYIPPALAKFKENERSLDVNEHYLFHGTTKQAAHSIAQDGFNVQLSNPRSLYGQGIYFAEKFNKADQYTKAFASHDNELTVILCRVVLGDAFRCHKHNAGRWKHPPCVCCKKEYCTANFWSKKGWYDSVLGTGHGMLFREFVVYDRAQCYPEYIIRYKRTDRKKNDKCTMF